MELSVQKIVKGNYVSISFLTIILSFLLIPQLLSQSQDTFYIDLGDNTGINTESFLPGLNISAKQLVDSFPSTFQSKFKVYSLGFYLHTSEYTGRIPMEFKRIIDSVDLMSNFSLLIGRESNELQTNSRFWVRIKLPQSGIFSCYSEAELAMIQSRLYFVINNDHNLSYVESEKRAMKELIKIISDAKNCCLPGRSPYSCPNCPDSTQLLRNLMEQFGFTQIPITTLTKSVKLDTTGNVDEYVAMTVNIGNQQINVNSDIEGFLNKMDGAMHGVEGKILFYSPSDTNCHQVMNSIIEGGDEEYVTLLGLESQQSRSVDPFTFKVTVVGTIDENNIPSLHIKIDEVPEQKETGHSIYLYCLQGCGFEMNDVEDTVKYFYSLLGTYLPPNSYFPNFIDLIPDVQVVHSTLSVSEVAENTIVLYGEPSLLVRMVRVARGGKDAIYAELAPYFNDTYDELANFFDPNLDALEKGHPFLNNKSGRICLIRQDLAEHVPKFKAKTKNQLAAFLTFHATGHNSGIDHENDRFNPEYEMSYMSDACIIVSYYLGNPIPYNFRNPCASYDHKYQFQSLGTFVYETMTTGEYVDWIKSKVYVRFIK